MQHLALYRKYRPKRFSDVIGQTDITATLGNSVKSGTVSHAYLFTGSRGTGKTSVAKIFAASVNCLSPLFDGSPCGTCARCLLENNFDILEIDAASNSGVDEIRALRDGINFLPVNGGYKVYIIDEVHMLSGEAFNALLKTLEEPPAYTVFILATTEVQKLPMTILSRCMRFDFRLVGTEELATHLAGIFEKENQPATSDAVRAIADAGEGSVRDTLSIADMCRSFSPIEITYDAVLTVLGASDPSSILDIAAAVLAGDAGRTLTLIARLLELGKSPQSLSRDLRTAFRDIGVASILETPETVLILPTSRLEQLKKLSADPARIAYCIDTVANAETDLRYGLSPRLTFESALLKCCSPLCVDYNAAAAAISALERRVAALEECLRRP